MNGVLPPPPPPPPLCLQPSEKTTRQAVAMAASCFIPPPRARTARRCATTAPGEQERVSLERPGFVNAKKGSALPFLGKASVFRDGRLSSAGRATPDRQPLSTERASLAERIPRGGSQWKR